MQREGFGIRFGAALIDGVIMIVGAIVIGLVLGFVLPPYVGGVVGALFSLAYSSLEIFKGATPGKMFLKLQITDEAGNPASRDQLVRRWAVKNAGSILAVVAALTTLGFINWAGSLCSLGILAGAFMMLKPHRQAWHDTFAKTAVCRASSTGVQLVPAPAPTQNEPLKQAA